MKKTVCILLSVLMLLGALPFAAHGATVVKSGYCGAVGDGSNITWALTDDGTLTLSGTGKMRDFTWFDAVLDTPWYDYDFNTTRINAVVIQNGITNIGCSAFEDCVYLKSVIIPDSVTSIGDNAFNNCSSLQSMTIPDSITHLGLNSFGYIDEDSQCCLPWFYSLTDGPVYFGKVLYCYKGEMPNNTSLNIKSGTLQIGQYAFSKCSGLINVTIPDSVTDIGRDAFYCCSGLNSITIPSRLTSIAYCTFSGCSALTSVTIPDSVTSIDESAFSGCTSLSSITLPSSVTSIGSNAFYNTAWYNNQPDGLVYLGKAVYKWKGQMSGTQANVTINSGTNCIASSAFYGCDILKNVVLPDSVVNINTSAFRNCFMLQTINIPAAVTTIGSSAFFNCKSLGSISLPSSLSSIGSTAFSGCSLLTSINLPNSVTSIGYGAFKNCSSLTSIIIPDSITTILGETFSGCTALNTVTPSKNLKQLGEEAFSGCALEEISFSSGLQRIGYCAFYHCADLKKVVFRSGLKAIGFSAFEGCTKLTTVTLPDGLEKIGCHCFLDCTSLKELTLPDSIVNIANSPESMSEDYFYEMLYNEDYTNDRRALCLWSGITKLVVPPNIKTIFEQFKGMNNLQQLYLSEGVTKIGSYAFQENLLQTITIPNTLSEIGSNAFVGYRLNSIYIPDTVSSIGEYAFSGSLLNKLYLGSGITDIYQGAFNNCNTLTTVYYGGTQSQWNEIAIRVGNNNLTNATVVYNHKHTWGDPVVIQTATLERTGLQTRTCAVCEGVKSENIPRVDSVKLSADRFVWNDSVQQPDVTVTDVKGNVLTEGTDYTVTYSAESAEVGSYTATVKGKTAYDFEVVLPYTIVPKAVTGLTAVATAENEITLSWTAAHGATQYNIYRYDAAREKDVYLGTASATAAAYAAQNLTPGELTTLRVVSVTKKNGATLIGETASVTEKVLGKPAAPETVTAAATADRQITVSWSESLGATQYNVSRYNGEKKAYVYLGTSYGLSYDVTGLNPGTTYYFKVTPVMKGNGMTFVGPASAAAHTKAAGLLAAPQNAAAKVGGDRALKVSWTKVTGATGYCVYVYDDAGYTALGESTTNSFIAAGLTPWQTHTFYVTTLSASDGLRFESSYSNAASAEAVTGPAAPANAAGEGISTSAIRLTWNASRGATQYNISKKNDAGSFAYLGTVYDTEYTAEGLSVGASYQFRVTPVLKRDGVTLVGTPAAVSARTVGAPAAPKGVSAVPTAANEITVSWKKSDGATQYNVYRYNGAKKAYVYIGTSYGLSYKAKDLTAGTTYYFKVVAVAKEAGETYVGPYSAAASAKCIGVPAAPANLTAKATAENAITLTWNAVNAATSYVVAGPDGASVTVTDPTYTATGLTPAQTYTFTVAAQTTEQALTLTGPVASASAMAAGTPAVPTGLTAKPTAANTVTVTCQPAAGATGYRVYVYNPTAKAYEYYGGSLDTTLTVAGLTSGRNYSFRVTAICEADGLCFESAKSNYVTSNAWGVPETVQNVNAVPCAANRLYLSWETVPNATQYNIYQKNAAGKFAYLGTSYDDSYILSGVASGTACSFKVMSVTKKDGLTLTGSLSAAADATAVGKPAAVTGLTAASEAKGSVTLSWNAVSGATRYNVYRYNGTQKAYVYVGAANGTDYTVTGLSSNVTYYFKVAAVSTGGGLTFVGSRSGSVSAKAK